MDTTEIKKLVNAHVNDIDKRLSTIELNVKKRNGWALIKDKINVNPSRTDESILDEMTKQFGKDCLKSLIVTVADKFVKDFDESITAQSYDLKMIVNSK